VKVLIEYIEYKSELIIRNNNVIVNASVNLELNDIISKKESNDFLKLDKEDLLEFIENETTEKLYQTTVEIY
jgi:hypothetical protein